MTCNFANSPIEDMKWLDLPAAEHGKSQRVVLRMVIRWYRRHIVSNR
jgi:hypothetical protein